MDSKSFTWRYIPFGTYSGPENMAIDEYFLNEVIKGNSPNVLRFYKWNPTTASIGKNQSLNSEIDLESAKKHGIDVVRRISGGGAVLHDAIGEITYAVVCRLSDIPKLKNSPRIYDSSIPERYQIILESLANGLEQLGVPIDIGKIHCPALLTQGKKISGNAQAIRKKVLLQHGTILLTVDGEFMYKILKAPVGLSYTRMVQSVRAKVTGIYQEEGLNVQKEEHSETEIVEALREGFHRIFEMNLDQKEIQPEEWNKIIELAQNRYMDPIWTSRYK
ncbi:MAG: lipoate--protein ligase family protein [Promethearchaeota archaeon]